MDLRFLIFINPERGVIPGNTSANILLLLFLLGFIIILVLFPFFMDKKGKLNETSGKVLGFLSLLLLYAFALIFIYIGYQSVAEFDNILKYILLGGAVLFSLMFIPILIYLYIIIIRKKKEQKYKRKTGIYLNLLRFDFALISIITALVQGIGQSSNTSIAVNALLISLYFFPELIGRKTPGKFITRISIRTAGGEKPNVYQLFIRYLIKNSWCLLFAMGALMKNDSFYIFGIIAGFALLIGIIPQLFRQEPGRALHDIPAGTRLVYERDI